MQRYFSGLAGGKNVLSLRVGVGNLYLFIFFGGEEGIFILIACSGFVIV